MEAVARDSCSHESSGKLVGEHVERELRTTVGSQSSDPHLAVAIDVFQMEAGRVVARRGDVYHSRRRACFQVFKQEIGQKKRGEVVQRHGPLYSIRALGVS